MAKYKVDFPMTIWATEIIEAESEAQAKRIAEKLLGSWEFFCERLYPEYKDVDVHENWENCEDPQVLYCGGYEDATLSDDMIRGFIGEYEIPRRTDCELLADLSLQAYDDRGNYLGDVDSIEFDLASVLDGRNLDGIEDGHDLYNYIEDNQDVLIEDAIDLGLVETRGFSTSIGIPWEEDLDAYLKARNEGKEPELGDVYQFCDLCAFLDEPDDFNVAAIEDELREKGIIVVTENGNWYWAANTDDKELAEIAFKHAIR
jgi:hypothetical protein